jgi:hypothetical protein
VRDTRDTPSYPRYPTGGSFLPVWIWLFGGEHMSIHMTYIYIHKQYYYLIFLGPTFRLVWHVLLERNSTMSLP